MTTTEATPTLTAPAPAVTAPPRTLSILALIAGVVSIVTGQAFVVPIAAIVLGVFGYRQEPAARGFSVWGIVLGGLALFGWVIVAAFGLAFALPFLPLAFL